jgi:RNA polymerase sigma-70 factor (ECF subfamily)
MGQRLTRAKARIREAGVRFETPGPADLGPRLAAVLEAVYAAWGAGWDGFGEGAADGLAAEALFLGRAVEALAPDSAEAKGLLALILYGEARRPARRDASGAYAPLAAQDVARWSRPMIAEAEALLRAAAALRAPGRFQTEAAIQSLHVERRLTGVAAPAALVALYDALVALAPSVGATVARAAAVGEALGPEAGLAALDTVAAADRARYQPFWATRAHLLAAAGRGAEAAEAHDRALALTADPATRAFLAARRAALGR